MSSKIRSFDKDKDAATSPMPKGKKNKKRSSLKDIQPRQENSSSPSPKKKSKSGGIKPIARIPCSREDSSCNWKALLQKQGKAVPTPSSQRSRIENTSKGGEPPKLLASSTCVRDKSEQKSLSGRDRRRSISTSLSQASTMSSEMEGACGGEDTEVRSTGSRQSVDVSRKVKKEFRALGLPESQHGFVQQKQRSRASASSFALPRGAVKKLPFPVGVNDLGYFDYNHYGELRSPLTPAHMKYTEDTGIIAMDCEMVGVGPMKESALGRVSIVNEYGYCLYDSFVKPKMEITDYRTEFSGIREKDMEKATPFHIAVKNVANLLRSHILVGHSLKSDMSVLFLHHPKAQIRDTALFFKKIFHTNTPKLRTLVKKALDVKIQEGEHSSITDAQATMALYQLYQPNWEEYALQTNRGVDVFRQTLDEFKAGLANSRLKKNANWYDVYPPSRSDSLPNVYSQDDQLSASDGVPAFSPSLSNVASADSSGLSSSRGFSPGPFPDDHFPNFNTCFYPMPPAPPPIYNEPNVVPPFHGGYPLSFHHATPPQMSMSVSPTDEDNIVESMHAWCMDWIEECVKVHVECNFDNLSLSEPEWEQDWWSGSEDTISIPGVESATISVVGTDGSDTISVADADNEYDADSEHDSEMTEVVSNPM